MLSLDAKPIQDDVLLDLGICATHTLGARFKQQHHTAVRKSIRVKAGKVYGRGTLGVRSGSISRPKGTPELTRCSDTLTPRLIGKRGVRLELLGCCSIFDSRKCSNSLRTPITAVKQCRRRAIVQGNAANTQPQYAASIHSP